MPAATVPGGCGPNCGPKATLRTWLRRHWLRALSTRPQRPRTTVADPAGGRGHRILLAGPARAHRP
ncbi:hypothetical protein Q3A66_12810 [Hymenobacter sp. BT770]|uniref:hypothetical protein n=1 Tax=Hymenobacter sp. BT770 TaxID=2886942 RepID=UPI001D10729F|nr:hypothetical protein [Hymenobacter sp. BT770]MCC3153802.1 hypothetical protein [Hymenobacter sp. BT770]MDO3415946.1 hypothetical protein [Hymenobacter sp. BT770]